MEEGALHAKTTEFSLSRLLSDLLQGFMQPMEEKQIALGTQIQPDICLRADSGQIEQLISVLLDNAVKYCDAGGEIRVSLRCRHHPVFTVENTYAEVDRLELDRLFDRFYRADKARTFTGSFGIGLSIAQSIAKKHKGSVTAYKKEGVIGFRAELKER